MLLMNLMELNPAIKLDAEDYNTYMFKTAYIADNGYIFIQMPGSKTEHLHVLIQGKKTGFIVDHENRDKLDNRRLNLRHITSAHNRTNSSQVNGSSKYRGVSFHKRTGKWRVDMLLNGKATTVGSYNSELEAAEKYNFYAILYNGNDAYINVLP